MSKTWPLHDSIIRFQDSAAVCWCYTKTYFLNLGKKKTLYIDVKVNKMFSFINLKGLNTVMRIYSIRQRIGYRNRRSAKVLIGNYGIAKGTDVESRPSNCSLIDCGKIFGTGCLPRMCDDLRIMLPSVCQESPLWSPQLRNKNFTSTKTLDVWQWHYLSLWCHTDVHPFLDKFKFFKLL